MLYVMKHLDLCAEMVMYGTSKRRIIAGCSFKVSDCWKREIQKASRTEGQVRRCTKLKIRLGILKERILG